MEDVFCRIIKGEIPSTKIYEDDDVLAIMDISQATKGHALVMPKKHCECVLDCPEDTLAKIYKIAQKIANAEMKAFSALGVNILTNAKEAAGQSVPHFHVHVLPRYGANDGLDIRFAEHEPDFAEIASRCEKIKECL